MKNEEKKDIYILIKNIKTNKIFRFPRFLINEIPDGFNEITKIHRIGMRPGYEECVYDNNGRLKMNYCSFERIVPKKVINV